MHKSQERNGAQTTKHMEGCNTPHSLGTTIHLAQPFTWHNHSLGTTTDAKRVVWGHALYRTIFYDDS